MSTHSEYVDSYYSRTQIGQLAPDLWYCMGFGGRGMATTTMGGELVASAIAEADERYRLFDYNRELRRDPTLRGQIVLRIRIEPDGSVSLCELQASDMDAPQLSAKVVDRVQTFDFGAKEVSAVTILYPIDFLPAT